MKFGIPDADPSEVPDEDWNRTPDSVKNLHRFAECRGGHGAATLAGLIYGLTTRTPGGFGLGQLLQV